MADNHADINTTSPVIRVIDYKLTKDHNKPKIKINQSYRLHCLTAVDIYLPQCLWIPSPMRDFQICIVTQATNQPDGDK